MIGLILAAAVGAQSACTAAALPGDWFIRDLKPDGTDGAYSCGLGVDANGTVTWSICRRDGPLGYWFGLEGAFDSSGDGGRVSGTVNESAVDAVLTGCGQGEVPKVDGRVVVTDEGMPTVRMLFYGHRMAKDEVDRLVKRFDDAIADGERDVQDLEGSGLPVGK